MSVLDKVITLVKAGHQPPEIVSDSIVDWLQDPAVSTSISRLLQEIAEKIVVFPQNKGDANHCMRLEKSVETFICIVFVYLTFVKPYIIY